MLETALETALVLRGMPSQSCYHCEWEAVTASVLRRFIDASGSDSLIHGNMFTADCTGLRGKVDAVVAGLPCPAFSCAGKQKGNGDSRAWGEDFDPADESTWGPQPHYLRLAEQILPGIVIIENVPQYLTGGHYAPVGEILYPMGYEYQDAILGTASSVGGSHKRERCFIMAVHREYDIWARLREIGVEELADSLRNGAGKGSGNGKKVRALSRKERGGGKGLNLATETKRWPTSAARDVKGMNGEAHTESRERPHLDQLPNAVKNWATATAKHGGMDPVAERTRPGGGDADLQKQAYVFPSTPPESKHTWLGVLLQEWTRPECPRLNAVFQWWLLSLPSPMLICSESAGTALMLWKRQLVSAASLIAGLKVVKKENTQMEFKL